MVVVKASNREANHQDNHHSGQHQQDDHAIGEDPDYPDYPDYTDDDDLELFDEAEYNRGLSQDDNSTVDWFTLSEEPRFTHPPHVSLVQPRCCNWPILGEASKVILY